MPRISNAKKTRQKNAKKATESCKVTIEEVPDEGDTTASRFSAAPPHDHANPIQTYHSHPSEPPDAEADPTDWDFDLGNELPDIDCGDQCPDLDEEIISAPEISNEGELDAFTAFLPKDLKNKGFSNVFDYMKEMKRRKDEKELEESEPEHDNESSDLGEHLVDDHTPSNENESRDNFIVSLIPF
ncbi:hypothetical protein B0H17DRAFT_1139675 [Mycena rosella]|uniref:Uncharacterized protein n=1 Tax=Mycena rosella TaxID=1033263 RepID=A0AAD7D3H8_MYCRO|nr:hypothetical protein B0H17DRAFT_1139675 [Mycena rosella]